jgi:hypothetical protein
VKKNIVFMFSAYYDKKYYRVKFPEFLTKDKKITYATSYHPSAPFPERGQPQGVPAWKPTTFLDRKSISRLRYRKPCRCGYR